MSHCGHYGDPIANFNANKSRSSSDPARAEILGWVLDGYSDGQIARRMRRSPDEVAAVRSALRSEGWA